jgi:phosphatidylglycerophosphatase A
VRLARLIASFFGVGYFPVAAGTAGSLAAVVIGAGIMVWAPSMLPLAACVAALVGVWAVARSGEANNDPGWVVIDEVAGMWLTMIGLTHVSAIGVLAAFLLFRLLDITKPGPIGWADRQHSAAGLWAVGSRWPELGL